MNPEMKDELIEDLKIELEGTANFLRGMLFDPSIPQTVKAALRTKITELDKDYRRVVMNPVIKDTIIDLVYNFLNDDRKGDEQLPNGKIEEEIADGETSIDEIVAVFKQELIKGVESGE